MEDEQAIRTLTVRQMTLEAEDVLSLSLVSTDRGSLKPWTVGAHIDLILPDNFVRQYSLCGDPADASEYKIAVLNEPVSRGGSRYIHEHLRPGMRVDVVGPRNNFPLVDAEHYLVIAGGVGVTPLLPLVRALDHAGADWRLLYGGRRRASMAFVNELELLGPRVVIRPEDEFGLLDLAGAIGATPADTVTYCCGPESLIQAVESECANRGRPAPHVERFSARPGHLEDLEAQAAADYEFEVVLARSERNFVVPAGKTIIEVLRDNGVFVMTSCTEGYCGVCETRVLEGIPDHRDDYLTPEERATNMRMMICCGRSKTPRLVLQI